MFSWNPLALFLSTPPFLSSSYSSPLNCCRHLFAVHQQKGVHFTAHKFFFTPSVIITCTASVPFLTCARLIPFL